MLTDEDVRSEHTHPGRLGRWCATRLDLHCRGVHLEKPPSAVIEYNNTAKTAMILVEPDALSPNPYTAYITIVFYVLQEKLLLFVRE